MNGRQARGRILRICARPAFRNEAHNPYNALLYSQFRDVPDIQIQEHEFSIHALRCDVIHLHWPEHDFLFYGGFRTSFRVIRNWLWLAMARVLRRRIVWTAHNEFPHDIGTNRLNPCLWRLSLRVSTHVAYMSCASKSRLQSLYPFLVNKRAGLVRHGDYADGQRNVGSWSPALPDALEHALTSGNVVLCFGQIKPYKNVERLIDVFRELKDAQLRLCIVGKVSPPEYADRLSARAAQDPRIVLFDARVEEDLLRAVIRRARLVVLPYRRILNSGSILLSMGCATPVLAPSVDTVLELAADVGHGWIRTFSDELTDDDLLQAIDAGRPPVAPDMCLFRWSRVAEALAQLYRSAR